MRDFFPNHPAAYDSHVQVSMIDIWRAELVS